MSELPLAKGPPAAESHLAELELILQQEIPMCAQMGIQPYRHGPQGLEMRLPLDQNRNHQQTAFAGSLNALCTIAGWGTVFLLLKELGRDGTIVIRRSTIRYFEPVDTAQIAACCPPVAEELRNFFLEMLDDKGQAKLDLKVEIAGAHRPAVVFDGSYVVALTGANASG